jgi:hypothetical protein
MLFRLPFNGQFNNHPNYVLTDVIGWNIDFMLYAYRLGPERIGQGSTYIFLYSK